MKSTEKKLAFDCLLLKTPDDRYFFTEQANLPLLIEFGRTFNIEISIVKTKEKVEILEMEDLAKSICSQVHVGHPEYETIEIKLPSVVKKSLSDRDERTKKAKEINDYIRSQLLEGKSISIAGLEEKFKDISRSSLANYITRTRRELTAQGHYLVKESPGQYKIAPEKKPESFDVWKDFTN